MFSKLFGSFFTKDDILKNEKEQQTTQNNQEERKKQKNNNFNVVQEVNNDKYKGIDTQELDGQNQISRRKLSNIEQQQINQTFRVYENDFSDFLIMYDTEVEIKALQNKDWSEIVQKKSIEGVSKERIQFSLLKGIPYDIRKDVWLILSGVDELKAKHKFNYDEKCRTESPSDYIIVKDLNRTFTEMKFFQAYDKHDRVNQFVFQYIFTSTIYIFFYYYFQILTILFLNYIQYLYINQPLYPHNFANDNRIFIIIIIIDSYKQLQVFQIISYFGIFSIKSEYQKFNGKQPKFFLKSLTPFQNNVDLKKTDILMGLFNQKYEGREKLFRVLRAYSHFDKEIGYTQGMNFIAASLLVHMNPDNEKEIEVCIINKEYEENIFWILVHIMWDKSWRVLFLDGTPGIHKMINTLETKMKEFIPKIYQQINNVGVIIIYLCQLNYCFIIQNLALFIHIQNYQIANPI